MENFGLVKQVQFLSLNSQAEQCLTAGTSEFSQQSLPEHDAQNREKAQKERLSCALAQFERERNDTSFSRDCFFCRKTFTGNRSVLLEHFAQQHNFYVGAPDNIVFIHEFLDQLEVMVKELRCFYCEKTFREWDVLKEHMRKKQHKQINPDNKTFDRFYLINYLELGKTWKEVHQEEDGISQDESDNEMVECEGDYMLFVCLFCEMKFIDLDKTLQHLDEDHDFNLKLLKDTEKLTFYDQIKLINFIRRKVHDCECINCDSKFSCRDELSDHFSSTKHSSFLPHRSDWDQAIYYTPIFESDNFLCALDVEENESQDCSVYPEETTLPDFFDHIMEE